MHRRHPEYDPNRRREHDVDIEKEIQRLKNELHTKETELQLIKVQKVWEIHSLSRGEKEYRFSRDFRPVGKMLPSRMEPGLG